MSRGRVWLACLSVLALLVPATNASAASRLYWTNSTSHAGFQSIGFSNLNGTGQGGNFNTGGGTLNNASGMVMDPVANKAYWANAGANKISFANLDGSGAGGDLNTTGATVDAPTGIAIDTAGGRVLWANRNANTISYAELDGSGGGDLGTSGATVNTPKGVTVHQASGRVYWANSGTGANEISYAELDGSGGGDLDTTGATVNGPVGVAIDAAAGRIYWGNSEASKISYANLDGSGGGGDLNAPAGKTSSPGLAIDLTAGRVYWTTAQNPTDIFFTRLDGSGTGFFNWSGPTVIAPTFPTILAVPHGTGAPTVTGTPEFGEQLSCSPGTWAGDAPEAFLFRAHRTLSYQWRLNGSDIEGANSSTYTVNAAGDLTCQVTATNQAGSTAQTSSTITIAPASPTITGNATANAKVGEVIGNIATVAGGYNPTGYLIFRGFLPGNTDCGGNSDFSSVIWMTGNGTYSDESGFRPPSVGTYRWQISYGGDRANNYFHTDCNVANSTTEVVQATPTLSTSATAGAAIGSSISDEATLAGAYNPTGSITFTAYGPGDANCTGAAVYTSSPVTVSGDGPHANAPAFTPTALGTYRWRAAYSGDANHAAASTACNDPGGQSVINQATPALNTSATASATVGSSVSDEATLAGAYDPTGSITFTAYGPGDSDCTGSPVYTSSAVAVSGAGPYANSPAFTPTAPGTYRWRAAYSGDANNAAVSGACNDPNESSTVNQASPAISVSATPSVTLGGAIAGSATISGGHSPTGSITFTAYGPNDSSCNGPAAYSSSAVTVSGDDTYDNSPAFVPAVSGTYRWRAAYSGDANNEDASTACNAAGDTSVVNPLPPPALSTPPSSAFSFTRSGNRLRVAVTAPGTVSVAGAGRPSLLKPSGASGDPPTIVVPLRLTKRAKTTLREKGKISLRATITFTPTGGTAGAQTASLKIKGGKKE